MGNFEAAEKKVVELLSVVLADTYSLALKTHNYHWNIEGPEFFTLHRVFEEQYNELYEAADDLAERMRTMGGYAPGGFKEFAELSNIVDAHPKTNSKEMVDNLISGHGIIVEDAQRLLKACETAGDEITTDMIIGRVKSHLKTIWKLRSSL